MYMCILETAKNCSLHSYLQIYMYYVYVVHGVENWCLFLFPGPVDPKAVWEALGHKFKMVITRVTLQGPPACGKTSLIDLLLDKPPAEKRPITDINVSPAGPVVTGIMAVEKDIHWESMSLERIFTMVCEAVKKVIDDRAAQAPGSDSSPDLPGDDLSFSSETIARLLDKLPGVTGSTKLFDTHYLFVTESGGQPHFMNLAPLFFRDGGFHIYTMRCYERLDDKPDYPFLIKGKQLRLSDSDLRMTNLQMICALAMATTVIRPLVIPCEEPRSIDNSARFMVVGTFQDKVDDCPGETPEEKNEILQDRLSFYGHNRVEYDYCVIIPFDSLTTDQETREKDKRLLRQKIVWVSGPTVKIEIPIRWLVLLLHMIHSAEKQGKAIIELGNCTDVGKSLKMKKQETLEALQFFHDLCLVFHFPTKKLNNLVFMSPMPIVEKFNLLIAVSFMKKDMVNHLLKPKFSRRDQQFFQKHGRFRKELLEAHLDFTSPLTADVFLDILEYLKLIIPVKGSSSEFFMPSVLPYATKEELDERRQVSRFPWFLELKCGRGISDIYMIFPSNMYYTIVMDLLASHGFEMDHSTRQYRNAMSLVYTAGGGILHIIDYRYRLEFYYTEAIEKPELCPVIRAAVLECTVAAENFHGFTSCEFQHIDAFHCPCNRYEPPHVVAYNHKNHKALCDWTRSPNVLHPQFLCWLSTSRKYMFVHV